MEYYNTGMRNIPEKDNGSSAEKSYFRMRDSVQILREEQVLEQDLQGIQSLYPESAKILLPYIEDICDKMEYEGSSMYMEFPDQETILRISRSIAEKVKDQFEPDEEIQKDEMMTMQFCGGPGGCGRPPHHHHRNRLEDLIRIMLLQEIYRRRCRHHRCR